MSEVFFLDYSKEVDVLPGIEGLCAQSGILKGISKGDSVAVKVHMGELGNVTYIRPAFLRKVVDLVKKRGAKPFVTDTVTLYPGARSNKKRYLSTAAYNGFVKESVGAPIVIADGDGDEGTPVALEDVVGRCDLREVEVASGIYDADFLLVLSHVKGHMITGFGGAVKNLGMGCVAKRSKREQHRANPPLLDDSKCDGCEGCLEVCPVDALSMRGGRPQRDPEKCIYCGTCLFACSRKALYWERKNKERFQVYLAHAAAAVVRGFGHRIGFVNFVQDVTPHCDCAAPAGRVLFPDIGILASTDPVGLDKASLDLIDRARMIGVTKPISGPDKLGKWHQVDSLVQLRTAQELGMGSMDYILSNL
ncbi:MAG: DUF362 domain-containing protein [Dehalococcoidia bacterium]|nr:DUF362 domain-containing protein [Dehalococcoidia bacterium]